MITIAERRKAFRDLHKSGCFAIPNPWDGATATRLAKRGFKALASTSAGAAWALGKDDGAMTLQEVLAHLRFLVGVTDLPVNADFEAGFADSAGGVADNVRACVDTGVAGLSIEDKIGQTLLPLDAAAERVRAAAEAIKRSGHDVMLVGRCEAYAMTPLDMDDVIARLNAYAAAGAEVLYAPGLRRLEDVARVVRETALPVNANLANTSLPVAEFATIGVRRVSVGAALAKATYQAFDNYVDMLEGNGRLP